MGLPKEADCYQCGQYGPVRWLPQAPGLSGFMVALCLKCAGVKKSRPKKTS
jgi:hypothetical protein